MTVTTTDLTTYEGDRVIVAVPLGVLQANKIQFTPPLADSKIRAINRLGVGVMDKLWLEFPFQFWTADSNTDWIGFISDKPGQWVETLNVYKYLNIPVLLMFNIGMSAKSFST